jgi:hypothetical protein
MLSKMPFYDLNPEAVVTVLGIVKKQCPTSAALAKADYTLNDFSLTYLGCFLRVQLMLLPKADWRLD